MLCHVGEKVQANDQQFRYVDQLSAFVDVVDSLTHQVKVDNPLHGWSANNVSAC